MINDNTILSSFDDRPTLLEWLKKVEDALKTDTATAVSVENPSANTYVFKITFADGDSISSGNVVFPDSVKDVSIKNGHIIVTSVGGNVEDLGILNPYAEKIVENAVTNTTEIRNNVEVGGKLEVSGEASITGNATLGGNLGVTGQAVIGGGGSINGALGVTGNATIGGTITAGGKAIKAVEANPTGEATEILEKIKIGDVAYNVGGSENDRVLTLILPYASTAQPSYDKRYTTIDDENVWNNLNNYFYETIKIYYNDGKPLGVFNVLDYYDPQGNFKKAYTIIVPQYRGGQYSRWYGMQTSYSYCYSLRFYTTGGSKRVGFSDGEAYPYYDFDKSKFDALYKLADKPTQDGNYILKASVSGGVVTYTWELQQ